MTLQRQFAFLMSVLLLTRQCYLCSASPSVFRNFQSSPLGIGVSRAVRSTRWSSSSSSNAIPCIAWDDLDVQDALDRDFVLYGDEDEEPKELYYPRTPRQSHITSTAAIHNNPNHNNNNNDNVLPASSRLTTKSNSKVLPASTTTTTAFAVASRPLVFWENMVCGAISRSIAQTVMHPANTMKTILQSTRGTTTFRSLLQPRMLPTLTRGAGANFVLSVPHGAVNFAVLELVRSKLSALVPAGESLGPALDFASSAISTICCSVVSTPQMMITDNIMAGNYPRLSAAIKGLYAERGLLGFYAGWWPGLVGKIPSYALTWTFFQQLKRVRAAVSGRPAKNAENTIMGCIASAATVCIMIPMDTIKTRLVTQMSGKLLLDGVPYKGILDCGFRIAKEEGIKTFYRGLAPRLISVVPMIGIQFGVYEAMKKVMLSRGTSLQEPTKKQAPGKAKPPMDVERYGTEEALEEAAMEVAASAHSPFPAPHFLKKLTPNKESKKSRTRSPTR